MAAGLVGGGSNGVWHFTPFAVDGARRLLTRDGVEFPLDRACFEILLCLLEHAGEVVTKDELLETAWPARVVGENSLNKAIGRVRTALLDDDQSLIRTVHGYGYRFAGPLSFVAPAPPATTSAPSMPLPAYAVGDWLPGRPSWTLTKCLGRGSFGEVWAARNNVDGELRAIKFSSGEAGLRALKREVALHKLMRAAAGDRVPAVKLLDWNLNTRPFRVEMPVVAGGNLRQWATQDDQLATLSPARRLQLMTRISEAVASVHDLGIIHKDLKPENILIEMDDEGNPRPLLTDFGAGWVGDYGPAHRAFPLSTELADALEESPQVVSALYAAPEALRPQSTVAPTAQVDVYALGILLYQIIVADLQRPLSPGWEDDVDDPLLRADIASAAAIEPAKRMDSARTLAEGLHWLERRRNEAAVHAQLAHTIAQSQHRARDARARRRKLAVLSAVLAVGMASTSWMYLRAERAGAAASLEAKRSQAMLDFMSNDVISHGDPYGTGGKEVSLRDAIDRGAARIDKAFKDDADSALSLHHAICKVYAGVGEYASAIDHCLAADQLAEQAASAGDGVAPAYRITLLNDLALAQIDGDRIADAEKTLERVHLLLPEKTSPALRLRTSATRVQLSYEQSRYGDAISQADRITADASTADRSFDDIRANALWYGALARQEVADYAGSQRDFIALIALRESTYGPEHLLTAWAYCNYGSLLTAIGRSEDAEGTLLKAILLFDNIVGATNPDATAPRHYLAQLYLMQERWNEAAVLLESVLEVRRQRLPAHHGWIKSATVNLADAYLGLGRVDDADKLLAPLRPDAHEPPATAEQKAFRYGFLVTEAELFRLRGDFERALVSIVEALPLIAEINSDRSPYYAMVACQHGRILKGMNRDEDARFAFDACTSSLAAGVPGDHPWLQQARRWQSDKRIAGHSSQKAAMLAH